MYIPPDPAAKINNNISSVSKLPIRVYHWEELSNLGSRDYLIKGILDKGGMSVVYGDSNSGKTFFALDIAAHISTGCGWQERRTKDGRVVYIAAESGLGVAERLEAYRKHYDLIFCGDLHLISQTISLCGMNNDYDRLIEAIEEIGDIQLIVIDTLARAIGNGNENNPDDMGLFIRTCDLIREKTRAHVMIIHHSGKDTSKGARGHSSLRAATDTEIQVSKEDGIITAEVVKQRDGKTGTQFCFELEVIEVGMDEDGEPITSCVLCNADPMQKKRKLYGQKRRAFNILLNCLNEKGQVRNIRKDMPKVNCVTLNEYREQLKTEKLSSSDKPDSENKAITRAINELNNTGITYSYNGFIWAADKKDNH